MTNGPHIRRGGLLLAAAQGLTALKGRGLRCIASSWSNLGDFQTAEKLGLGRYFERARLQSCRNYRKMSWALAPEGRFSVFAVTCRRMLASAISVSLCSFCLSLIAHGSSLTAHDLAQRVDRHYNQLHSLKAGFSESYQGLGIKRTESGSMLLLKPGRMKWDYSSPPGKLFLLDGKYADHCCNFSRILFRKCDFDAVLTGFDFNLQFGICDQPGTFDFVVNWNINFLRPLEEVKVDFITLFSGHAARG